MMDSNVSLDVKKILLLLNIVYRISSNDDLILVNANKNRRISMCVEGLE